MSRGRLIFPCLAALRRLDTVATEVAGYDTRFRSPQMSYPAGAGAAPATTRRDSAEIRVKCQVEPNDDERQQQLASGNVPDSRIVLVFHFRDLVAADLVEAATGEAAIRVNTRLDALYHVRTGALIRRFRHPPGLFAVEARPQSHGLLGQGINLLLVTFADRPQGAQGQAS